MVAMMMLTVASMLTPRAEAREEIKKDSAKLVLRAERDLSGFKVQQALIFEKGKVVLSRNSNFMCMPSHEVKLGVFEAEYDEAKSVARETVEQISARLAQGAVAKASFSGHSPHELRLFIGEVELSKDSSEARSMKRLLESACDDLAWRAEHVALIELAGASKPDLLNVTEIGSKNDGGKPARRSIAAQKSCTLKDGDVWECAVKGYGKAYLTAK